MFFGSNQITGAHNLGRRLFKSRGVVLPWWSPDGATPGASVGGSCVGAYRAIDTPGSPWGAGPVNYAASLLNLANAGVNDLVEGNGAVPWAALTGWGFVAAAKKYFDTGLIPSNTQSWSVLIQYANNAVASVDLLGVRPAPNRDFRIRADHAGASALYANGAFLLVAPALATGNLGIAGSQGYRNGVADGGAIGAWVGASVDSVFIGCRNDGGGVPTVGTYCTADIESIAIYNVTLTAPQVLARATAMAAL